MPDVLKDIVAWEANSHTGSGDFEPNFSFEQQEENNGK